MSKEKIMIYIWLGILTLFMLFLLIDNIGMHERIDKNISLFCPHLCLWQEMNNITAIPFIECLRVCVK